MENIIYSLSIIGPIFLIIAAGAVLRRFRIIDPSLSDRVSRLVFHLFLPALIIWSMAGTDFLELFSFRLVFSAWGTVLFSFAAAWMIARLAKSDRETCGLFASGSTWSNVAIVGYALSEAIYGVEGLARAAMFSAVVLPIHIALGYPALTRKLPEGSHLRPSKSLITSLSANPVMISVLIGITLSFLPRGLPSVVDNVLGVLGRASLPLALVAIGGSLEFRKDPAGWAEPLGAAAVKLLLMPAAAYGFAKLAGLSASWTGSVVIGFACPTAVSFFVISRSLGHEASRSAAIVTATTVGAALTTGIVAALLIFAGLS